jgi:hypothetical protein
MLAKQLQALEPLKEGRLGNPAVDGVMTNYIEAGSQKYLAGVQRPLEIMRHIIRWELLSCTCILW